MLRKEIKNFHQLNQGFFVNSFNKFYSLERTLPSTIRNFLLEFCWELINPLSHECEYLRMF